MPLLPKERDILPDDIFTLDATVFPWGVAHVRSRQEKTLARRLAEHGVPFYLPLSHTRRSRGGRTFDSHLPLFSGYVFHRAMLEQRDVLWRSNVVAQLIDVPAQSELGEELEQLRRLQLAGASLQVYHELVAGQPVRIESGPFAGYSGVVLRGKGHNRLVVKISLLRQAVVVEFDREVLRRLPPA